MRHCKNGFTLMETIVVLVVVSLAAIVALPNFTPTVERARATNAQNNLLAIYTAEQNYMNNNNSNNTAFCVVGSAPTPCDTLADINSALSLNIQDDGTYFYSCSMAGGAPQCSAVRNNPSANLTLSVALNAPINLVTQAGNPSCGPSTGNTKWCP